METWKNLQKVSQLMSVFQALTLMLMFGTFVLTLLDYIKKHHK
ncbi:MAG: putative holin-like toxin [Lactobacillus sp.]|nr:putative holin-like toxin [Lactobacillus sp.]